MGKLIQIGDLRIDPQKITSYAQTWDGEDNEPQLKIQCEGKVWEIPIEVLEEPEQREAIKTLDKILL